MTSRIECSADQLVFDIDLYLIRAVLLACGACYVGLSYIAWGWPSIDGYPAIERFLDPTFLREDFYTGTSEGYGVDTLPAFFFGALERISGVDYEVILALLNLLRCLAFPWLVYQFFLVMSGDRTVALLGAVMGTLANFELPRTLGWSWVWGDASTAMFAVFAITLGWIFLLRRVAWPCFLLLSLATLLHPLTALLGTIFVGLVLFLDYRGEELWAALRSPLNLASGGLFAALFLAQYLLLSATPDVQLATSEYVHIIAHERHPDDYLPSRFGRTRSLAFGFAALAVLVLLWRLWGSLPRRRLIVGTLAAYATLGVLGYLFVEVWPLRFFVQLIPFRTAFIGAPIMLLVVACFAARELREGRYAVVALLLGAFFLASPAAAHLGLPYAGLLVVVAAAVVFVVALVDTRVRPNIWPVIQRPLAVVLGGRRLGVTLCLGLLLIAVAAGAARREAFVVPNISNQHPLYAWVRDHTDPSATFLVEQYSSSDAYRRAVNPQKMRLIGRRAVLASMDFPFLDKDMRPWYAGWREVLQRGALDRVETADLETLLELRQRFPFDYVVRRTPLPDHPSLVMAAAFGASQDLEGLFVYRLLGSKEQGRP